MRLTEYDRENIAQISAPFRTGPQSRPAGISDSDKASEYALQMELEHLKALMADCIARVNKNSSLVKIDLKAWENFCADELPDNLAWDEKISNAGRGYDD